MSPITVIGKGNDASVVDERGEVLADCASFLERLRIRGLSEFTVEAYAHDLALVHRWLAQEHVEFRGLTATHVHRFVAWERGRGSQPKSINRRLHTLRLFYRFVFRTDLPG